MGKLRRDLIFSIIGILIMFLGFLLPPFAGISKAGVIIIFIFAGALLLWTFVSGDWAWETTLSSRSCSSPYCSAVCKCLGHSLI